MRGILFERLDARTKALSGVAGLERAHVAFWQSLLAMIAVHNIDEQHAVNVSHSRPALRISDALFYSPCEDIAMVAELREATTCIVRKARSLECGINTLVHEEMLRRSLVNTTSFLEILKTQREGILSTAARLSAPRSAIGGPHAVPVLLQPLPGKDIQIVLHRQSMVIATKTVGVFARQMLVQFIPADSKIRLVFSNWERDPVNESLTIREAKRRFGSPDGFLRLFYSFVCAVE